MNFEAKAYINSVEKMSETFNGNNTFDIKNQKFDFSEAINF
jgi:hypothetical protein